jgi:SAM-dependent methyltransferase
MPEGAIENRTPSINLEEFFSRRFCPRLERAYGYVDALCQHLCFHLVHECRLLEAGSGTLQELKDRSGSVPAAQYLLRTVLDVLVEGGSLAIQGDEWRVCRPCPADRSLELQRQAREDCPEALATFELIARCHDYAPGYLTGRKPGMAAVFPSGSLQLWERLHTTDSVMSVYADLLEVPLSLLLKRNAARVLEVGAGVGSVVRKYSHLLRDGLTDYWFTDVGRLFVERARNTYKGESFLRFAVIDLDMPLSTQGLEKESFEAVIAVNVMHSAKDLAFTLREVHSILKKPGDLICAEGSPPTPGRRWPLDLIFAFLQGWWDVSLDPILRPRAGFLFPSEWRHALLTCGFDSVCAQPGEGWFAGPCRGGLIIASKGQSRLPEFMEARFNAVVQ